MTTSLAICRGNPWVSTTFIPATCIELIHPDTDRHVLDNNSVATTGIWLGDNHNLFGAPSVMSFSQSSLLTPGETTTPLSHGAKRVILPIKFKTENPIHLNKVRATFLRFLDPIYNAISPTGDGELFLRHQSALGGVKFLPVILESGQTSAPTHHKDARILQMVLVFKADWPYWAGERKIVTASVNIAPPPPGTTNTAIGGDIPAYGLYEFSAISALTFPNLTITQPGGNLIKLGALTAPLNTRLFIETRIGRQAVWTSDIATPTIKTSRWDLLDPISKFSPFQPGANAWSHQAGVGSNAQLNLKLWDTTLDAW